MVRDGKGKEGGGKRDCNADHPRDRAGREVVLGCFESAFSFVPRYVCVCLSWVGWEGANGILRCKGVDGKYIGI